jgi:hypothetical protein
MKAAFPLPRQAGIDTDFITENRVSRDAYETPEGDLSSSGVFPLIGTFVPIRGKCSAIYPFALKWAGRDRR